MTHLTANTRDCEHGRQLGKCDTCDLIEAEKEIEQLKSLLVEVQDGATGQAPCERFCEAKAAELTVKQLKREVKTLQNINDGHKQNTERVAILTEWCMQNGVGMPGDITTEAVVKEIKRLRADNERLKEKLQHALECASEAYDNGYRCRIAEEKLRLAEQRAETAEQRVKELERERDELLAQNELLMEVSWEMKEGVPDAYYKIKDARNTSSTEALANRDTEQQLKGIKDACDYANDKCVTGGGYFGEDYESKFKQNGAFAFKGACLIYAKKLKEKLNKGAER